MIHPIEAFRKEHGLTLAAFAQLVGVKKSAVSKWQRGVGPSVAMAIEVEKATSIPREALRPDVFVKREAAE